MSQNCSASGYFLQAPPSGEDEASSDGFPCTASFSLLDILLFFFRTQFARVHKTLPWSESFVVCEFALQRGKDSL